MRACFSVTDGIEHAAEVDAESLYEAVALAVAQFCVAEMLDDLPKPMTEFTVTVIREPVQHKIRLQRVERWAQPTAIDGPAPILKREKAMRASRTMERRSIGRTPIASAPRLGGLRHRYSWSEAA